MDDHILYSHVVTEEEHGKMLKQILQGRWMFSRSMIRRCKTRGLVSVNGKEVYYSSRVEQGDTIKLSKDSVSESSIIPEQIDLSIVHEDRDLIVLEKPAGIVVHPTKGYPRGTIANGLAGYFQRKGEQASIHLVNRLDKDTSGLMVVAKHSFAHSYLAQELTRRKVKRTYLALVQGVIKEDHGKIDAPIGLMEESVIQRQVCTAHGKPAITHFTVRQRMERATLVELQLETGRTHQIRVHLAHFGHPIIGDPLYGVLDDQRLSRQALHAHRIEFCHPRDQQQKKWKSFFPEDIMKLYVRLRMIV